MQVRVLPAAFMLVVRYIFVVLIVAALALLLALITNRNVDVVFAALLGATALYRAMEGSRG